MASGKAHTGEDIVEYFEFSREPNYIVGASSLPVEWHEGQPIPIESLVRFGYGNAAAEFLASDAQATFQTEFMVPHSNKE